MTQVSKIQNEARPESPWRDVNKGRVFRNPSNEEQDHVKVCCSYHGCVFGEPDCPVVGHTVEQRGDCEDCMIGNPNKRSHGTV